MTDEEGGSPTWPPAWDYWNYARGAVVRVGVASLVCILAPKTRAYADAAHAILAVRGGNDRATPPSPPRLLIHSLY